MNAGSRSPATKRVFSYAALLASPADKGPIASHSLRREGLISPGTVFHHESAAKISVKLPTPIRRCFPTCVDKVGNRFEVRPLR